MRSILAAIARVLRAMPRFVYQRMLIAGEWIARLVAVPAEPVPDAGDLPAAAMAAAEDDEHTKAVRAIAAHVLNNQIPSPSLSGALSEDEFNWLLACTPSMLRSIIAADHTALRDHIRNKRAIRGVLLNDPRVVAAFTEDLSDENGEVLQSGFAPAMAR